jgi:hypothetical protein
MRCRDAQFYLRLRRHAGDELGAEVVGDLDRHLAACPACAIDARAAASFDTAVASAMRSVPVPVGLREKLLTQAATYRGGVIRRKVYRYAALAASVFLASGLAFGLFASRPVLDTTALVMNADEQLQNPDESLRRWLADQKLPPQLPLPFNTDLLLSMGTERVQGRDVPVVVFTHPSERGFAKVYILRGGTPLNPKDAQDAQASLTVARVIPDRDTTYVVVHTVHPVGPNEDLLKPFLRVAGPPG